MKDISATSCKVCGNVTLLLYRNYNDESSQNHMYCIIVSQLVIAQRNIKLNEYLLYSMLKLFMLPKSFSIVNFDPVYPIFMRYWKPLSRVNREKLHKKLRTLNSWISILPNKTVLNGLLLITHTNVSLIN